jgi:RNAse (barnase) inhibitor barstar
MIKFIVLLFLSQIGWAKTGKVLSPETKLTGYYPDDSALEGGFKDRYGQKLNTLQDFLAGRVPYVSLAMDYKEEMSKYMKTYFCIPQLDKNYAKEMSKEVQKKYKGHILFKVVDTGGAFVHKKWKKMDICVKDKKASYDERLNIKTAIHDCNQLAASIKE